MICSDVNRPSIQGYARSCAIGTVIPRGRRRYQGEIFCLLTHEAYTGTCGGRPVQGEQALDRLGSQARLVWLLYLRYSPPRRSRYLSSPHYLYAPRAIEEGILSAGRGGSADGHPVGGVGV